MKELFRSRNLILIGGTLLVLAFMIWSDPNGGALTTTMAAQLATPVVAVWFAHLARKALFDYIDMETLYQEAKRTSIGAAITFASICLLLFALLGLFGNQVRAQEVSTYIPTQAITYVPILKAEQQALWVDHPKPICLQVLSNKSPV